jgi:hypothetical protein
MIPVIVLSSIFYLTPSSTLIKLILDFIIIMYHLELTPESYEMSFKRVGGLKFDTHPI